MAIKYVAYNWQGEKVQGVLQTDSEEEAYERLEEDQLVPYRLTPHVRRRSIVERFPGLFRPGPQEVIDFTRQLASLLRAGISLRRGLIVQREASRSMGLKDAVRQVIEDIESGSRFSDACATHPNVFPEFYIRLLRVGEATGGIGATLDQLHETMTKRKAVRDRVRSALTYPAISLLVAIIAGFVLITYSLPSLTGMLAEFGGTLPLPTRMLISIAHFLEVFGLIVMGMMGATGFAIVAFMRTRLGSIVRSHVLLKTPVVGTVVTHSNIFFLTTNLSTLLDAGLSPIEALNLAQEGMNNYLMRERLALVTAEASKGERLHEAFSHETIFPAVLSQSLASGETSGNLHDTLTGLADYYEEETERAVTWATELIQPTVIMILSGLVGFVAVAIVAGIYATLGNVE